MSQSDGAAARVAVELDVLPGIGYDLVHNGRPFIRHLSVRSSGSEPETDVTVSVSLTEGGSNVARPWVREFPVIPPSGVEVEPEIELDPVFMRNVEEQRPVMLSVRASSGDVELGSAQRRLQLYAHNQWMLFPEAESLTMMLLAAHVQPNAPVIADVLGRAREILKRRTGSGATQGYQAGPGRALEIARAVYEAIISIGFHYSDPPASWDSPRQKIRDHGQVLEERAATCLDSAVLYAAALEAAGLHATIWIPPGHALVGVWLQERSLPKAAIVDPSLTSRAMNETDAGNLTLVETTVMASQEDFAAATRAGADAVHGSVGPIQGVVDIREARLMGITPLPATRIAQDGSVEVHTYQAGEIRVEKASTVSEEASRRTSDMPLKVRVWKNTLLDLSLRNQLINFRETATSVAVRLPRSSDDLHPLDFIEDELYGGADFTLLPLDGAAGLDGIRGAGAAATAGDRDVLANLLVAKRAALVKVDSDRYLTRMRKLRYASRSSIQESGSNNLYLTLGSLMWEHDGRPLQSPLILVPVVLEGGTRGSPFHMVLDESGASTPNYCLLEKLRVELGLQLPELENPLADSAGVAVKQIFDRVRQALSEADLPFRIDETAYLATLQFAKFRLWKDLEDHWERFAEKPLVRHLIHSRTEPFVDGTEVPESERSLDELAAACPIPADGTQLHAIRSAVDGRTFVLEGPPGTGKSQTITNLLARAVAEGRRVLFVAEKRAALDVVQSRMESVGLGPFCLDLHDKGSKPALVRQQLLESLHHHPSRDPAGVEAAQVQLRSAVTILSRYRDRLHGENAAGFSLYGAHERILAMTEGNEDAASIDISAEEIGALTADRWAVLRPRLLDMGQAIDAADDELDGPWRLAGPVDFDTIDRGALEGALLQVQSGLDGADRHPAGQDAIALLLADGSLGVFEQFADARPPALEVLDAMADPAWSARAGQLLAEVRQQASSEPLASATPALWGLPLDALQHDAHDADASGIFGRKKRRLAVLERLRPGLRQEPQKLKELSGVVGDLRAARDRLAAVLATLDAMPGMAGAGRVNALDPAQLEGLANRVGWNEWLARAVTAESAERALLRNYASDGSQPRDAVEAAQRFDAAWRAVREELRVDDDSLDLWRGGQSVPEAVRDSLDAWLADSEGRRFRRLAVWLGAAGPIGELRAAGLPSVVDAVLHRQIDPLVLEEAVTLGVLKASLAERASASRLDAFQASAHERSVERFARSSAMLRERMAEEIPADLIRARPFTSKSLIGEVGALQRELNKERRGLSIRRLLGRYGRIISELTPCFLVSPDSAARFLEPGAIEFDLVVFDEASQIRVAEAIGAMGRGKAAVVVGDSRQMPPSIFGGASGDADGEIEGEEESAADEESILSECVQARVPREWLSWHYRSRDESLIAFSNSKYYAGKLASFPAPVTALAGQTVSHVLVPDGYFHRSGDRGTLRTNPQEARAVVADVVARFRSDPQASVGVITFNVQQRDLIIDLLSSCGEPAVVASLEADGTDSLFVKNLENVQGDERDAIVFSLGFSKNDRGVLPLNFGPLNRNGGERRLNVAVTRARSSVRVFSSFLPKDMRLDATESRGVRHLHDYLEMAVRGVDDLADKLGRAPTPEDRHRDSVADALQRRGWPVRGDVGLSGFRIDIVVGRSDGQDGDVAAILLDGPGWAGRETVGDRDGLPVEVLTRLMDWPLVARVWLPAWLEDSESVVDALEEQLTAAQRHAGQPTPTSAPVSVEPPTVDPAASSMTLSLSDFERAVLEDHPVEAPRVLPGLTRGPSAASQAERKYKPWRGRYVGAGDGASREQVRASVTELMKEVIDAEGPIHVDRLVRVTADAVGVGRLTADLSATFRGLMPRDRTRTQEDHVYWPRSMDPRTYVEYRRSRTDERALAQVPVIEVGNALVLPVEHAMGVDREELLRLGMKVFGAERLTAQTRAVMEAGLADAIERGRLAEDDNLIVRGATP